MSAGETDLSKLLASLRPRLRPGVYVFVTLPPGKAAPAADALMRFEETEGTTLILAEEAALRAGLATAFRCRWISLEVHSSLDAVGLLACVAARLACAGIAVNVISAFHHDHLFVRPELAEKTMRLLAEMAAADAG